MRFVGPVLLADALMTQPGKLYYAQVDGQDAVVYLSLITEEKGNERRNHCYRYCPPSNAIIPSSCELKLGEAVGLDSRIKCR